VGAYLLLSALALWRLRGQREARRYGILLGVTLILPLVLMSAVSSVIPIWHPRYFSFAYPHFCIFLALGIDTFPWRGGKTLLLAAVITMNAAGLANYYYDPAFQRDPWRAVASLLKEDARPADAVFVCCGEATIALNYYYPINDAPTGLQAPFLGTPEEARPYFQAIIDRRARAWLIAWADWGLTPVYGAALGEHCLGIAHPEFGGVRVTLYESCAP
jgi:hypothetical protein